MIKQKLEEIGTYFKTKVINGEFEFVSCGLHTATIEIDGYKFQLWITNEIKNNFDFHRDDMFGNETLIESFKFSTQKERMQAWKQLKPFIVKYQNTIALKEKQEELKKLKNEIEKLK